ncbi:hypothetical protein GCM10010174_03630 [Kutzneria viridogrisea]|uniref:Uncharacterized membrane protein HdeD (DUF308 family) n=1 Tax=Kutzneria viridogrisea TaxID=47990 RepID=A0ABR6BRR1_9PSEU|nr:uncharacterized membrane protein HdeD (DUF308 family) [Kutzneria viridogrisea]
MTASGPDDQYESSPPAGPGWWWPVIGSVLTIEGLVVVFDGNGSSGLFVLLFIGVLVLAWLGVDHHDGPPGST